MLSSQMAYSAIAAVAQAAAAPAKSVMAAASVSICARVTAFRQRAGIRRGAR